MRSAFAGSERGDSSVINMQRDVHGHSPTSTTLRHVDLIVRPIGFSLRCCTVSLDGDASRKLHTLVITVSSSLLPSHLFTVFSSSCSSHFPIAAVDMGIIKRSAQSGEEIAASPTVATSTPEKEIGAVHAETTSALDTDATSKWKVSKAGDGDVAMALFDSPDEMHEPIDPKEEARVVRKIDFMILPYLSVCYMFFYIVCELIGDCYLSKWSTPDAG